MNTVDREKILDELRRLVESKARDCILLGKPTIVAVSDVRAASFEAGNKLDLGQERTELLMESCCKDLVLRIRWTNLLLGVNGPDVVAGEVLAAEAYRQANLSEREWLSCVVNFENRDAVYLVKKLEMWRERWFKGYLNLDESNRLKYASGLIAYAVQNVWRGL